MAWVLVIRAKQFETDSVAFRTYPTSKTNHKKSQISLKNIYQNFAFMFDLIVKSHSRRTTHMLPFENAGIPQENCILIELQEDY